MFAGHSPLGVERLSAMSSVEAGSSGSAAGAAVGGDRGLALWLLALKLIAMAQRSGRGWLC